MHPVAAAEIEAARPALIELCERYAVDRLWVFGSAVGEEFNPERSDLDLLIERSEPPQGMNAFRQLMGFMREVEALFPREVQITDWRSARSPYFRANLESSRVELHAA